MAHQLTVILNDQPLTALEGQTVAAVLLTHRQRVFRHTAAGRPRGLFCGIGICFDCLLTVNGTPNVRTCLTPVTEGMIIETAAAEVST